jgi:hypothetical protein
MMSPFQSIVIIQASISISKNPMMHSKKKHIPIKYHFLWEQVAEKNIRVEYVGTKEQVANIFTKLLPREAFEYILPETQSNFYSKMNAFECLSYMSYIYMRKHHKEDSSGWEISFRKSSVRGSSPRWKDTFAIDDKGGEIY